MASALSLVWKMAGVPDPVEEFRFHPRRRFRFDFCWVDLKLALEVEGGAWTGGRHVRGKGFIADLEKYNEALCLGWRVLRVTPQQLQSGKAAEWIMRAAKGEI
jgi:very-short-patch-repair endonuclease